ncbi:nucleotide sugar dehydrogenase [Anoxynatronum buryatiense]|uniref:UDP-N-acetyl-D-glucosamine dehydrogenase n=1 Tax=Anoxynatronum buryatiense TaxID=489973 RepID=A0AA45WVH9_9CLOT|nr:nucleotide sugar dehydrogenase [Anoxynatronum buryatiense]SMP52663.1 UDP-N-acetyl-D-glucosamine dehydrogenase [Anoxynatronum buryatiense]
MNKDYTTRFQEKDISVGIIGLGYVGLPLAVAFASVECRVIGLDCDNEKVTMLMDKRESYLLHIANETIEQMVINGHFRATTDLSEVKEVDVIILCLPTPLNKYHEPDLSYITDTLQEIAPFLKKGQLLSLESTTYPGTTEELIQPIIEAKGFRVGEDFFLVYSPEREDPGNEHFTTATIPKVIGGVTTTCLEMGKRIYGRIIEKLVPVSTVKAAELTKLLENIYRAVNIGLVNEMKIVADRMGIDIWEVIEAAATKPFGFNAFYPGPGWGGHCIPIDPFYLTWKAKEYGVNTDFIELAGRVNTQMPAWVVEKVTDALNQHHKSVNGSKILILGLAYKKNISDTRESPSVKIMELLRQKGAEIAYSDPYVKSFPVMREHQFDLKSIEMTPDSLSKMDCVVLCTDHDYFDYEMIENYSALMVDTRGVYKKYKHQIIHA